MRFRLGWFVGPKFLLCDGLGWVGSVVWWIGLKKLDPPTTLVFSTYQVRFHVTSISLLTQRTVYIAVFSP